MFDAPNAVPALVKQIMADEFDAVAAVVAAEQGLTLPNLGDVIDDDAATEAFPYGSVTEPSGKIASITNAVVSGPVELWVFVTDRDMDTDELRKRRNAWLASLVRLFLNRYAPDHSWEIRPVEWTASPPFKKATDTTYLMGAGVKLLVTIAETTN